MIAGAILLQARVHARLRRRPARPLHAHVHQARRVARLDLRPHQGVRGLRRASRSAPSRTGDDVWLLAGAALALQVLRHSIDFSYPQAQHQAMGAVRQPPLEQVQRRRSARAVPARARARGRASRRGAGRAAARAADARAAAARRVARRSTARARGRWVKKIVGFPIGERFAAISITAALFDARVDVHRAARLGRLRRDATRSPGACCARSAGAARSRSTAPRPPPRARSTPTATTGRSRSRSAGSRAARAAGLRARPRRRSPSLLAVIAIAGDGASWPLAGGALVVAGAARRRVSPGGRCATACAGRCRPRCASTEYAGILWVAALAGPSSVPAAFALLCAITFRHYDIVYRLRQRGVDAAALAQPRGRRLGRAAARRASCSRPPRPSRPASTPPPRCSRSCSWPRRSHSWADVRAHAAARRLRGRGGGRGVIGMVLAAGAGRRLAPYTDTLPKTLVPVDGDRTILDIALGEPQGAPGSTTSPSSPATPPAPSRSARPRSRRATASRSSSSSTTEAEVWNNAYSLWCARAPVRRRACCSSTATRSTRRASRRRCSASRGPDILLALDDVKPLGEEEMKVHVRTTAA